MRPNEQYRYHSQNADTTNFPLRVNYDDSKPRFSYRNSQTPSARKDCPPSSLRDHKESETLESLRNLLDQERRKNKLLEEKTVKEQMQVLEQLQFLETRFSEISAEKDSLESQLSRWKSNDRNSKEEHWKNKYYDLEKEHLKVKQVSAALVTMMKKVDGIEGSPKKAWKWVKRVVWEHEAVRNKALEWKKAYDQVSSSCDSLYEQYISDDESN